MEKKKMVEYIDFVAFITSTFGGKAIQPGIAEFHRFEDYDVHCAVLATQPDFKMVLMQDGWLAFVFEDEIQIHRCTVVDELLTDKHIKHNLN